ncbi:ABC-ATPase domain-containing protein, partial [Micrococcus sp. SIMBA_144]
TVLVMGGSGDYFEVADQVILMENYRPYDVTKKAKEIAQESARQKEGGETFGDARKRVPARSSLNSQKGKKSKVTARGLHQIQYG